MQRWANLIMAATVAIVATIAAPALAASPDRSGSLPAQGESQRPAPRSSAKSLGAGAPVLAPIGWVEFCGHAAHDADCKVPEASPEIVHADARLRRQIARVNRNVNAAVAPMSDMDNYGVEELWAYPDNGRGDCEDYVLLKRRLLIEAGLPRQALLITVVREQNGDGHAVLTVVTDRGDLILDNKRDRIVAWNETGYDFIKRQSAEDPNVWVDLRGSANLVARR